ncbi:Transcriptional regulator, MarR family [Tritonibacter mobilis]|uniref:MarR family winged helix-turn-helix transcriptional regulator n=1 Tax=Tritonibacter mobilis TaxID=379347 RepID=UPI000806DE45|nr:MarR family transcriptional regulator [Tritonibacter mobilis]PXW81123.1 MarR family transcriptional regulator [Ruegeria sp. P4]MCA2006348.1 MarR family transcriptional regulator [Tritonibacter mobilis]NHM19609.1 MarR family transcriptional regulator [Tritonibacter mobilis]NHM23758.1 MarR family transcriptional regulator [Tritonibacter mobilis]VCU57827.1 Transcriptional regulator, MarR family [Tritonibacter mobilis]
MSSANPRAEVRDVASKARLRLWLKLLKTSGSIEAELRRRLRDRHNTTLPRFDVMSALSRNPEGLKMSQLSQFLRVSNGNVTGIVDRLTDDGLALRVAVPGDRRAQVARLTPAGEAEFARLAAEHEAWIDEMMAGLGADDITDMSALLDQIQPIGANQTSKDDLT